MTKTKHERYRGPGSFKDTPGHRSTFYSRDAEIRTITQKIIASPLVVLFGKSGTGKTSLLQAGLSPRLRAEGFLPITVRLSSSETLLELVAEAAQTLSGNLGIDYVPGETGCLWEFFKTAMFWQGDRLMTPVLVFDQFEEIFTLGDTAWKKAFSDEIGPLVSGNPPDAVRARARSGADENRMSDTPPQVKIVISLKEEYLGALQELSPEIPRLFQDRVRLLPLSESQAKKAIQKPASKTAPVDADYAFKSPPFEYDPDTLKEMLEFLKGRTDVIEPVQLQVLCQHVERVILKDKERTSGDDLIKIMPGDLGGPAAMNAVLQRFYTNALAELSPGERRRARQLCEMGLLTSGGHRLMLEEHQIRKEYNLSVDTLEHLVRERILRREPRLESLFYELSHDTLAQSIVQLRRWRIPKKYRLAVAVGGVALAALLCAGIWFVHSVQTERKKAEDLVAFLIGEDLMGKIRPVGQLQIMDRVQVKVDEYLQSLSKTGITDASRRNQALAWLNKGDLFRKRGELEQARGHYEKALVNFSWLVEKKPEDAIRRRDLGTAKAKLGVIAGAQWRLQEALDLHRQALDIREQLVEVKQRENQGGEEPLDALQLDLAKSHNYVGDVLSQQRHLTDALGHYERAINIAERHAKSSQNANQWLYRLQDGYAGLGGVYEAQGKYDSAEEAYNLFREIAVQVVKQSPFEAEARYRYAVAISKITNLESLDNPHDVLPQYQKAHAMIEDLTTWDPSNKYWARDFAAVTILVGEAHNYRGYSDSALVYHQKAKAMFENFIGIDTTNAEWQKDLSWSHKSIGAAYSKKRSFGDALAHYDSAFAILKSLKSIDGTNSSVTFDLVENYRLRADILKQQESKAALENYQQALTALDSTQFRDRTDASYGDWTSYLYTTIGDEYFIQGEIDKSIDAHLSALNAIDSTISMMPSTSYFHSQKGWAHYRLGTAYQKKGNFTKTLEAYTQAEQALREAIELKSKNYNAWNRLSLLLSGGFAELWTERGNQEKSRAAYVAAIAAAESALAVNPNDIVLLDNFYNASKKAGDELKAQGKLLQATNAYERAEQALRDAIDKKKKDYNRYNKLFLLFYDEIAKLWIERGNQNKAREAYVEALSAVKKAVALNEEDAVLHSNLHYAYKQVGDDVKAQGELTRAMSNYKNAEKAIRRAIALNEDDADYHNKLFLLFYDKIAPLHDTQENRSGAMEAYKTALSAIEKAVALNPEDPDYHYNLYVVNKRNGDQLSEQGDLAQAMDAYESAERAMREAIELMKEDKAKYWNILYRLLENWKAPLFDKRGDEAGKEETYQAALTAIQNAVTLKNEEPIYVCNLGGAYGNLGRWDEMIEHCKKAVGLRRTKATDSYGLDFYYEWLAAAYYWGGRIEEFSGLFEDSEEFSKDKDEQTLNTAILFLEKQLGHDPDNAELKQTIEILKN